MDPDEALRIIRVAVAMTHRIEATASGPLDDCWRDLAEAAGALDTWLSNVGHLPTAWRRAGQTRSDAAGPARAVGDEPRPPAPSRLTTALGGTSVDAYPNDTALWIDWSEGSARWARTSRQQLDAVLAYLEDVLGPPDTLT